MVNFEFYAQLPDTAKILLSLAIMLLAGFLMTRITKLLKLPSVSAYIIAGILIGPFVLNMVPKEIVSNMGFISDIALAFIAFGVGKFFKKAVLKKAGWKIILVTLIESLFSSVLVTLVMYFAFHLNLTFSMVLGAIACATAPASTLMTIKQYNAKGNFVDVLLQVVALDDIVCLLIFSIALAIGGANDGNITAMDVIKPLGYNLLVIAVGAILAIILRLILNAKRSKDNRLIIVIMSLALLCAICAMLEVSPLLSCMIFSTIYVNLTDDDYLFHQIDNFTPPIMLMFFVISGMNLNLTSLATVGFIGIAYFLIRVIGKYLGAFFWAKITKQSEPVQKYLGLALIPQAGVAIGLAVLAERMLPDDLGILLSTLVLSSSIIAEFVGPACAKASLILSKSIKKDVKIKPALEMHDTNTIEMSVIKESQKSFKDNKDNTENN